MLRWALLRSVQPKVFAAQRVRVVFPGGARIPLAAGMVRCRWVLSGHPVMGGSRLRSGTPAMPGGWGGSFSCVTTLPRVPPLKRRGPREGDAGSMQSSLRRLGQRLLGVAKDSPSDRPWGQSWPLQRARSSTLGGGTLRWGPARPKGWVGIRRGGSPFVAWAF